MGVKVWVGIGVALLAGGVGSATVVSAVNGESAASTTASAPDASIAESVLAVRAHGQTQRPDVYAGVDSSDPNGKELLVVFLTTDDLAVRADFARASGQTDDAIVFMTVPFSAVRLNAIDARLRSDYDALHAEGFAIGGWRIAADRTGEEIIATTLTSEQRRTLDERYGPGLIFVDEPAEPVTSFVLPLVNGELPAS